MSLRLAVGCKSAEQQRGHMPTPEGQGLMDQPNLILSLMMHMDCRGVVHKR